MELGDEDMKRKNPRKKKPFYKKWWFWLIVIVVIIGAFSQGEEDNDITETENKTNESKEVKKNNKEEAEKDNNKEENEKVDNSKEDTTEGDKEEGPVTIEVDESVTSVDYTAKVQRVKIDDDELTVVFDWENQSDWDPAHFPLLGYVEVKQEDKVLKQIGGTDRQNKQIKRNRFDVYDLKYKLIDDSDITIRIVSTNEHDGSEGTITVRLD